MKLGFLTADFRDIEKAARLQFRGIEINTAAFGDATKDALDMDRLNQARAMSQKHGVEITALAYYRCATTPADVKLAPVEYARVFEAAAALGVTTIATLSGFDSNLDWDGNVQFFADRFGPVAALAEERGMRLAFENWMGFGGSLPFKPVNMGGAPDTWDAWFSAVPSRALGLEFDPSHLYWQGIDHMRALREYADRVYHVHAKDTEMLPERRYRGGVNGNYYRFRIPGYGEINWPQFISGLDEIGYRGGVAIEHEDTVYWKERYDEGLVRGWQTLNPLIK
ncbi:MAG: sugar phosphate isomerase/epimerase family protein [Candidatus Sumerlaeaceae bacterium]